MALACEQHNPRISHRARVFMCRLGVARWVSIWTRILIAGPAKEKSQSKGSPLPPFATRLWLRLSWGYLNVLLGTRGRGRCGVFLITNLPPMNPSHLHLMLNHLPLVGSAFSLLLLLVAFSIRSDELKRVSMAFFVLVALLALPAYLTGEPAEDLIEKLPGVSEDFIKPHEDSAQWALGAQILVGVAALGILLCLRHGKPLPNWGAGAFLLLILVAGALMARTANLGGQIRHPEIRSGPPPSLPSHQ